MASNLNAPYRSHLIKHSFHFRWVCRGLIAAMLCQLIGCGTLLYPERRGQTGGQLDTNIILLDGLGFLVFFLPGVISFAVDFATGAIYLPRGHKAQLTPEEKKAVADLAKDTPQQIPQYLSQKLLGENLIPHPIPFSEQWKTQPLLDINQWQQVAQHHLSATP